VLPEFLLGSVAFRVDLTARRFFPEALNFRLLSI
jgi:hypothetical protein